MNDYTEENNQLFSTKHPFNFIKGIGYANKNIAKKTINQIKNDDIYRQYQIISFLYNRSKYFINQTKNMKEAMKIFDNWLKNYNKDIIIPSNSKSWTIYGKLECSFFKKALKLIQVKSTLKIYCIEILPDNSNYEYTLKQLFFNKIEIPNFHTTPIIYKNKKLIGSYDDLSNFLYSS
jgi:glutaredoxin